MPSYPSPADVHNFYTQTSTPFQSAPSSTADDLVESFAGLSSAADKEISVANNVTGVDMETTESALQESIQELGVPFCREGEK